MNTSNSSSENISPDKQKRSVRSDKSWRRSDESIDQDSKEKDISPLSFGWASEGLVGDFHWKKYPQSALLLDTEATTKNKMDDGFLSNNVHFESVANKVFDHEEKHPSISHANQIDVSKRKEYDGIYRKRTSDSQTSAYEPYEYSDSELAHIYRDSFNKAEFQYVITNRLHSPSNEEPKCSVFETSCNMISLITGSGMLSLPFVASSMGWSAIFLLLILASCYIYSFSLVGKSIEYFLEAENLSNTRETINRGHYGALNNTEFNLKRDSSNEEEGSQDGGVTKRREEESQPTTDYLSLGKASFGKLGGRLVALCLSIELLLALVSFFINIGINITVINDRYDSIVGIFIAAGISLILACLKMKFAAYSSALGLMMTSLTLIALIISGWKVSNASLQEIGKDIRRYKIWDFEGWPISLGLISFCFGGHGAYPAIYNAMKDRSQSTKALVFSGISVSLIYLSVMIVGYFYYAQFTKIPVTLNIGRGFHGEDFEDGESLRVLSALGIVFNLQVTCPLVIYPLRDLLLKVISVQEETRNTQNRNMHKFMMSCIIILISTTLAVTMRGHFAVFCSLIGSITTTLNSIVLPICFYHQLSKVFHACPHRIKILHCLILCFCLGSAFLGISSATCHHFSSFSICRIFQNFLNHK